MSREATFAVVIPTNSYVRLRRCVTSLFANEPSLRGRVTALYDAATFHKAERLADVSYQAQGSAPFVTAREWNSGLRVAGDRDVVLLADDVVIPDQSSPVFGTCARVAALVDGLAMVHPSICDERFGNVTVEPTFVPGYVKREARMYPMVCAYLPTELRRAVGTFDENLTGYGAEDHDYVYRTRRAGLPLLAPDWVYVSHLTYSGGWRTKLGAHISIESAFKQLKKKWGEWPPAQIHYPTVKWK